MCKNSPRPESYRIGDFLIHGSHLLACLLTKPAHPSSDVFLADSLDTSPQGLNHNIFDPFLRVPVIQPLRRDSLSHS